MYERGYAPARVDERLECVKRLVFAELDGAYLYDGVVVVKAGGFQVKGYPDVVGKRRIGGVVGEQGLRSKGFLGCGYDKCSGWDKFNKSPIYVWYQIFRLGALMFWGYFWGILGQDGGRYF